MGEHRSADVGECVSLDELEALLKRRGDVSRRLRRWMVSDARRVASSFVADGGADAASVRCHVFRCEDCGKLALEVFADAAKPAVVH